MQQIDGKATPKPNDIPNFDLKMAGLKSFAAQLVHNAAKSRTQLPHNSNQLCTQLPPSNSRAQLQHNSTQLCTQLPPSNSRAQLPHNSAESSTQQEKKSCTTTTQLRKDTTQVGPVVHTTAGKTT